jgi:hypothetical protein
MASLEPETRIEAIELFGNILFQQTQIPSQPLASVLPVLFTERFKGTRRVSL